MIKYIYIYEIRLKSYLHFMTDGMPMGISQSIRFLAIKLIIGVVVNYWPKEATARSVCPRSFNNVTVLKHSSHC